MDEDRPGKMSHGPLVHTVVARRVGFKIHWGRPPASSLFVAVPLQWGAVRLRAAPQRFPPFLPLFGFVLCFLVNKEGAL